MVGATGQWSARVPRFHRRRCDRCGYYDSSLVLIPVDPANTSGLGSKDSVVQREINTFNSLIYNFKNTALDVAWMRAL
jgi:hypothetical protein